MSEEELMKLRGHHLKILEGYIIHDQNLDSLTKVLPYSENFTKLASKTVDSYLKGERKILITDSLDDVCFNCLGIRRDSCSSEQSAKDDRKVAEDYGVEIGQTYTAEELIEKLQNYIERNKKMVVWNDYGGGKAVE